MKGFFQFIFSKVFLKHLIIATVVFVALVFITLQLLKNYTHHGEEVEVPALKGLNMPSTIQILEQNNLTYEVIDSLFVADKPPGTVLEQMPPAGSKVKKGRSIYLTINTKTKKRVPLPDVEELSYRQARAMLESVGLKVEQVQHVPAEYSDLVVGVIFKGDKVMPGTRIEIGSGITLMVSEAAGQNEEIDSLSKYPPSVQDGDAESFF